MHAFTSRTNSFAGQCLSAKSPGASEQITNKQTSKQQTLQTLMSQPVETALHKIIREWRNALVTQALNCTAVAVSTMGPERRGRSV